MSELTELYRDLQTYSNFDKGNNTEDFLETVDKIVSHQNHQSITIILEYFDDEADYSWVLESASSSLEHYPMTMYVEELLKYLPKLLIKAPIWADGFFNKIFNQPKYLSHFEANMHFTPKESLFKLFDIMEVESPHHSDTIKNLRKASSQ